jgi:hypothetical protein
MFAISVVAYGQQSVTYEDLRVVNVEPPIEGPLQWPAALEAYRHKVEPLPQGLPIVTYEVRVHNGAWVPPDQIGSVASGGAYRADIYRNNGDSGYFFPIKGSDEGAFNASQAGFGGGWTGSGFVNGFDLLTFNSSANSGPSILRAMLWDGDPFGIAVTHCSPGGVPGPIPGTEVVFPEVPQGLDICPSVNTDPTPCVGLTRYVATFDKIPVDCDQVFIYYTLDSGCRHGWRIGSAPGGAWPPTVPAEIGFSDLIEQYYDCADAGACPTDSGLNVGFCCDTGEDCDEGPTDGSEVICPSRPGGGFCTDGVADFASAWNFGGGNISGYWASAVAGVQGATDVAIRMVDAINNKESYVSAAKGGFGVTIDFMLTDWDPGGSGLGVKAFQTGFDVNQFATATEGTITMWEPSCTTPADCVAAYGRAGGSAAAQVNCDGGVCTPVWIDNDDARYLLTGINDLPACDLVNVRCGSTILFGGPALSQGTDMYLMSGAVWVPVDGKGVWQLSPNPGQSNVLDANGQFLPMLGFDALTIEITTGQCCDLSVQPFECIEDGVTANECADLGGISTVGLTCADPCGCNEDSQCGDGDACTVDACVNNACSNTKVAIGPDECCDETTTTGSSADIGGLGAIASNVDGDQCTLDQCSLGGNRGVPENPPNEGGSCNDGSPCTYADTCQADGTCIGLNVNAVECSTEADCEAETGVAFPCVGGFCFCSVSPSCAVDLVDSAKPNGFCYAAGEKITAELTVGITPEPLVGGQFNLSWDPACVQFQDVAPVAPYTTILAKEVDQAGGTLFYAVGVGFDPATGDPLPGTNGGIIGAVTFTKLPGCGQCDICLMPGINPGDTLLSDSSGQAVKCDLADACDHVALNDVLTLTVPENQKVNADCKEPTALVDVGVPVGTGECGDVTVTTDAPVGPTALPQGVNTFTATVTSNKCGDSLTESWTVTVNDTQSLDIVLQLGSPMAGDVCRCITMELIADCVTGSNMNTTYQEEICFGQPGDFKNHFTDKLKVPKGQYQCIYVWDQQHTLRSVAALDCVDGQYSAEFKGDPFFGGNWLIGGNLDGWKKDNPQAGLDVIDILDFGQFIWMWGQQFDPNTTCDEKHSPHGDIDGNGVVDLGDLNFILNNFLASSKDDCCSGGTAAPPLARTEVSVRELREMGMGELGVADLNADGMVDMTDVQAFMDGVRPTKKAPRSPRGAGLGR